MISIDFAGVGPEPKTSREAAAAEIELTFLRMSFGFILKRSVLSVTVP